MSLRQSFLSFVGKRTVAEVCRFYVLPYFVIQRWASHGRDLPPWLEARVRDKLNLTDSTTPRYQCQQLVSSAEDQTRSYAEPARSA
jgi:hypothetical protein